MSYKLGLDLGIGSCGYAVLKTDSKGLPYKIIRLDSVVFPPGEAKFGKSVSEKRRGYRGNRRMNRRRKFRKRRVKEMFINSHILTKSQLSHVFDQKELPSVYELRDDGLKKRLSDTELYQVLYFLAGHRGFHSNRKHTKKNKKDGKILKAVKKSKHNLSVHGYRTYGQMLYHAPKFDHQKRNHDYNDGFIGMVTRIMIKNEALQILNVQKRFNPAVTDDFIHKYMTILTAYRDFDKGPSKPSPFAGNQIEKMIGRDTLDHTQQRSAKATYTFQIYDLLCRLNNLHIKERLKSWQPLTRSQKKTVYDLCFKYKKVTYKRIKKALGLNDSVHFNLVNYAKYKAQKSAERNSTFDSIDPVRQINSCLPKSLQNKPALIDAIGEILSKFSTDNSLKEAFKNRLPLKPAIIDKLLTLDFSKFGRLSIKTMRKLIPYLKAGYTSYQAIHRSGYYQENRVTSRYVQNNVKNPVVLRSFTIARKVVKAVINRYGKPDSINVELGRDLSKSYKERMKSQKRQKKFQKRNASASTFLTNHGLIINGPNITITNLYHEQQGIDPYTGAHINIRQAFNGRLYNVDHIIPYSWAYDDSYINKVLTSSKANEDKGNRLPLQYLKGPKRRKFLVKFAQSTIKSYRKRAHLLKMFASENEKLKYQSNWKKRNLNDTRYLTKLVANHLKQNVSFSKNANFSKQRVVSLNGGMTAKMRRRWGLTKIRADGDKHHALDATVIASVTTALVQRINHLNKYDEIKSNPALYNRYGGKKLGKQIFNSKLFHRFFNSFPLPWHDFREETIARLSEDPTKIMIGKPWKHYTNAEIKRLEPIHVVHVVNHKLSKPITGDTLRSGKYRKQGVVMNRFNVSDLKLKHSKRKGTVIKAGNFSYRPRKDKGDLAMKQMLIHDLELNDNDGKKAFPDGFLRYVAKNKYYIIRKIKLFKTSRSGIVVNGGQAVKDRKTIIRIDVFWDRKDHRYCDVIIYLNDTIKPKLPNVIACTSSYYGNLKYLTNDDKFQFSLTPFTPVHLTLSKPHKITWLAKDHSRYNYIKSFDGYYWKSGTQGTIYCMSFDRSYKFQLGLSNIVQFDKMTIDYLGFVHKVRHNTRLTFNRK